MGNTVSASSLCGRSRAKEIGTGQPSDSFWQRRIIAPLQMALRQGLTPMQLSFALALGWVTGMFPLIGVTLILCIGLAAVFRVNQLVAQITNWLAYPFLFLLFIPHVRLGALVLGMQKNPFTFDMIRQATSQGLGYFLKTCGPTVLCAVAGWIISAPFVFTGTYFVFLLLCRRISAALCSEASPS